MNQPLHLKRSDPRSNLLMPTLEQYNGGPEAYKRDQAIDYQTPLDAIFLQSDPCDV
jgi:hypothetical protein